MLKFLPITILSFTLWPLWSQATEGAASETQLEKNLQSTATVRTVTTKKATTQTQTVPETVMTVNSPDKVYVSEQALSWLSLGLRMNFDYNILSKGGSVCCASVYGEYYNDTFGVEASLGYMKMPVPGFIDSLGTTYVGEGTRNYLNLDLLGKWYLPWFKSIRREWIGLGVGQQVMLGGQVKWYNNGVAAANNNPTDAQTPLTQARWVDIPAGGNIFYMQIAAGFRFPIARGFNVVSLDADYRVIIPIPLISNATTGIGPILRVNFGFSYSFNL